jgi:class 3 adenylate cyclase
MDYTNANSDIHLNMPGKIKCGFFGFCDIRQFTVISECLQEQIMNYVNTIAELVHGTSDQFSGEANRNIGDAFLIAWILPQYENMTED